MGDTFLIGIVLQYFSFKDRIRLGLLSKLFKECVQKSFSNETITKEILISLNIRNENLYWFRYAHEIDIYKVSKYITKNEKALKKRSNTLFTDKGLAHLTDVYSIRIESRKVTDTGLSYLTKAKKIYLYLEYNNRITDEGLKYLANAEHITLVLNFKITDDGLKYLENVPSIDIRRFSDVHTQTWYYRSNNMNAISVTGNGISYLKNASYLKLAHIPCKEDTLVEFKNLKCLRLYNIPHVSDNSLYHMASLERLEIDSMKNISFDFLKHIGNSLIDLKIRHEKVEDTLSSYANLSCCTNLRSFSLHHCNINEADLQICLRRQIESIELDNCVNITFKGLIHFKDNLKILKYTPRNFNLNHNLKAALDDETLMNFTSLEELTLNCQTYLKGTFLPYLKNLRILRLNSYSRLFEWKNLENLHLKEINAVVSSDSIFSYIRTCEIIKLDIQPNFHAKNSSPFWDIPKHFNSLKHLTLRSVGNWKDKRTCCSLKRIFPHNTRISFHGVEEYHGISFKGTKSDFIFLINQERERMKKRAAMTPEQKTIETMGKRMKKMRMEILALRKRVCDNDCCQCSRPEASSDDLFIRSSYEE